MYIGAAMMMGHDVMDGVRYSSGIVSAGVVPKSICIVQHPLLYVAYACHLSIGRRDTLLTEMQ